MGSNMISLRAPARQSHPPAVRLGRIPELFANLKVSSGASVRIWTLSEDLLLGQGGHAETGIGHAPVYRSGPEMFSDLV